MRTLSTRSLLYPSSGTTLVALTCLLLAMPASVRAQGVWERPMENLQVLPEDSSPERVRAVMFAFTGALGVRCSHCHDDSQGGGFNNMDFASDAKPEKDIARAMMRMSQSINATVAEAVPGDTETVSVNCTTCHRGRPKPAMLEDLLAQTITSRDAAAAVEEYGLLREEYRDGFSFDFRDGTLVRLGDRLIADGRVDDAITMLRLNVEQYPNSSQAHTALGLAYMEKGESDVAEVFLHRAIVLDPDNRRALATLREINP